MTEITPSTMSTQHHSEASEQDGHDGLADEARLEEQPDRREVQTLHVASFHSRHIVYFSPA